MMAIITCPGCRHQNNVGARTCELCGKPLASAARARAMGYNPLNWLRGTAVGQMAPFILVALLLVCALLVGPSGPAWRQLLLSFGLVGIVTLAVTFPLLKGQYDLSAGPLAGLAATCAVTLSPLGWIPAVLGALAVGLVAGVINGLAVGWTRVSSALVTIITGAIALQITVSYTSHAELVVKDPLLTSLAETNVLGIPVVLTLFLLALAVAKLLSHEQAFLAVGTAPDRAAAEKRTTPHALLVVFLTSGLMAGIAGVLIASCGLAGMGLSGQVLWVLTPLAAALIGGASVAGGTGNLRTVAVGAGVIATTNWLCVQLRMPISGPVAETPFLVVGLLADRWKDMTGYMIRQARAGSLFAVPEELRLPMVMLMSGRMSAWRQFAALVCLLAVAVGIWAYVGFYVARKVPDNSAILARVTGVVMVGRYGTQALTPGQQGEVLHAGDIVTTGAEAEATLRMHDGSEVKLYPNTEMGIENLSIDDVGTRLTSLRMMAGGVFAKVRKLFGARSQFSVQTPLLTLGVRGTAFRVVTGTAGQQVAVGEGEVEVAQSIQTDPKAKGGRRVFQDIRKVDAGRALDADRIDAPGLVRELGQDEYTGLRTTAESIELAARHDAFSKLKSRWFTVLSGVIVVLYVWFVFIYCKPAPPSYLPDLIHRRAGELLASPTPTKADLPTAVALAQMCITTGNTLKAIETLKFIIRIDPNGDQGQWARRLHNDLVAKRPPSA